jgi:hypothetical protein
MAGVTSGGPQSPTGCLHCRKAAAALVPFGCCCPAFATPPHRPGFTWTLRTLCCPSVEGRPGCHRRAASTA